LTRLAKDIVYNPFGVEYGQTAIYPLAASGTPQNSYEILIFASSMSRKGASGFLLPRRLAHHAWIR
jgi:hypothetical protein